MTVSLNNLSLINSNDALMILCFSAVCAAGYGIGIQFNGVIFGECQPCLQGSFKSSVADTDCLLYFYGMDTARTGSVSLSECCKLI